MSALRFFRYPVVRAKIAASVYGCTLPGSDTSSAPAPRDGVVTATVVTAISRVSRVRSVIARARAAMPHAAVAAAISTSATTAVSGPRDFRSGGGAGTGEARV